MSNKQVIAIFFLGVAVLLGAFWAGLTVIKQNTAASSPDAAPSDQNAGPSDKRAVANNQRAAGPVSKQGNSLDAQVPAQPQNNEARYVVFVAAFGTLEKAKPLEAELHARKYLAAHIKMPTPNDPLYKVNIGPYEKSDADKVATQLSTEGRKGIMIFPWTPK